MELSLLITAAGVLGLLFGSFGNVVIHRVPAGASIVSPPSSCPSCARRVRAVDNIPVLSWLLLRGRCRDCKAPISVRYPVVELSSALLFAAIAARFGFDWALPGFLLFAWMLLVVSAIDVQTRRIPNRLTYPLTPVLAVLLVGAALLHGLPGVALRTLLGGVVAFTTLLVLALISPRGMGMGDVKLAAFIGLGLGYLGWGHVVVGLFGAFLLGGVAALVLVGLRLRRRKDLIPFGPYLALAALVAVFFGQRLIRAYLGLFGL